MKYFRALISMAISTAVILYFGSVLFAPTGVIIVYGYRFLFLATQLLLGLVAGIFQVIMMAITVPLTACFMFLQVLDNKEQEQRIRINIKSPTNPMKKTG